jgi:hypothetical protein
MYHYGCTINDTKEQKNVFQSALNALSSIQKTTDPTDRLFTYPINYEYNVKADPRFSLKFCSILYLIVISTFTY